MVDTWQTVRRAQALLTLLVAMSMLFATLSAARALPCHDYDGHQTVAAGSLQFEAANGNVGHRRASHILDHKACCNGCSLYAAVIETASVAVLDLFSTIQRYERNDRAINGLALLPALDPPRSQV
jgi:hypothetical protein